MARLAKLEAMPTIEGGKVKALIWRQPKTTARAYVLKDGDREVARLVFRSPIGSLARGEFKGRAVTFKRGGFLCPFISFRNEGEDRNLGVLQFSWGFELSGLLAMADGRSYKFHGPSLSKDYFEISDEKGKLLCRLSHESGLLRRKGEFHDLGLGVDDPDPLLMALLLWYAAMMMFDEELAASSAAAPGQCSIQGVDDARVR